MSESFSFTALDYEPQTALNISNGLEVTIKYDLSDSLNNDFVGVYLQLPCNTYFRWDNSSTDSIDSKNDLFFYANTFMRNDVPIKLAQEEGSIFLHLKQVKNKSNETIRWVKIR